MLRPGLLFLCALGAVLPATVAVESASRVPARWPADRQARPAPMWKNESWLNSDHPLSLEELRGRVVLLNFWVFTCYNCTNTLPAILAGFKTTHTRIWGLTIIGMHTPEFPPYAGEHDKGNPREGLEEI